MSGFQRAIAAQVTRATGSAPPPLPIATPVFMPAPIHGPGVTFDQLDDLPRILDRPCMCRWPLGATDDKPEFFCGATSVIGKTYCNEHQVIATDSGPSIDIRREVASIGSAQRRSPYHSIIDRLE